MLKKFFVRRRDKACLVSVPITIFLLLSSFTYGQHSVSGVVRDAETNESLVNATVQVKDTDLTLTDPFGRFRFGNVSAGKIVVVVTYVGYKDQEQTLDISADAELEIMMEPVSIITDAVVVRATRATGITPTTFTNITREKIEAQNFGQDVPFLLNWTPSVVTTSDAGTGIGYTGIRIRGSDPTRINVTINGIPYNDSESAGTFWVDIPDIASSAESIQIQRGVGTSTNGAGAFGATINLQTNLRRDEPYAEVSNAFGSFNTRKHTFNFGTGLINDHFAVDGRLSKIASDGFIDRAFSDLQSYYFSGGYYSEKTMLKALFFGGKERTYQSWYGVPESRLKNDTDAMLVTATNEGWNEEQTNNLLQSDSRTFNPYLYDNQVDDYRQDHYQLHFSHQPLSAFTINASLHYTPGKGYYEEYRYENNFADYGLPDLIIDDDESAAENDTITTTDLIRRRWLDNDFYGFTWSLNYDVNDWNIIAGGAWNRYDGNHFGQIVWSSRASVPHEHTYYFNNGDKRDLNTYVKVNYQFSDRLNVFADLQFRKINYEVSGTENNLRQVEVNAQFNFFNPKAGLTYSLSDESQLYASYAVANREPVRDDFLDFEGNSPEHETLKNLEVGYRGSGKAHTIQVNYYLMNYTNQLVLTGELNDVGAFIRTNAGKSYRMGFELQGMLKVSDKLLWNGNVTVSRNKIQEYKEIMEDYGPGFSGFGLMEKTFKDTDIAFSPALITGSSLSFRPFKDADITLLTKYVSDQYLDNTANDGRSIAAYLVNDLRFSYSWHPSFVKEINFSLLINNIFDEAYESNGFTYGYLAGLTEYRENFYYPQAGRNFMGMIGIKL
ncbi:MAG: TonB-dependent receptor [Cyclobacteriaceae bacterium]